jgi:hypothetical protein
MQKKSQLTLAYNQLTSSPQKSQQAQLTQLIQQAQLTSSPQQSQSQSPPTAIPAAALLPLIAAQAANEAVVINGQGQITVQ